MQEIVPLGSPILEVLGDRTEILLVKCNFNAFSTNLAEGILGSLLLILLGLNLEPVAIEIILILEEFLQDYVLVLLQNASLTVDESGEKTKILSGKLSASHARCLTVKTFD